MCIVIAIRRVKLIQQQKRIRIGRVKVLGDKTPVRLGHLPVKPATADEQAPRAGPKEKDAG